MLQAVKSLELCNHLLVDTTQRDDFGDVNLKQGVLFRFDFINVKLNFFRSLNFSQTKVIISTYDELKRHSN